jgi:hypothetical protein
MNLVIMQLPPASYCLILLGSKYSHQDPILKYPQSIPPLMSETKFTPTQNYMLNYNVVHF